MKLLYTLIILFAFFIGCESFGVFKHEHEHEHTYDNGLCFNEMTALISLGGGTYPYYECNQNRTQFDCSSSNWISDKTCEEYCSSKECDLEEAVDSAETVEETVSCECTIIE